MSTPAKFRVAPLLSWAAASLYVAVAVSLPAKAAIEVSPVGGGVVPTGDVSPVFTIGPVVDLTGQRIFLGFTSGDLGTQGAIDINPPGVLTAAQIVTGVGGLGVGTVTVNGAGSVINLTGGAAFNGLDIGSWGTGTVTVSNGGLIACATPAACLFNDIGNAAGSTGTLLINAGSVSGLGQVRVGAGNLLPGFGTSGASTSGTLSITNGGTLTSTGFSSVANNFGQTGVVSGSVTINGPGSSWSITRDLANGGGQAFLGIAPATNGHANVTISNGGNLTITGSRATPATDNSIPGFNMSAAAGATSTMTVTSGGSVRIGGDSGVITVGGSSFVSSAGSSATLNISGGGTISGTGPNGLYFMAIGQNLGTGIVNVSGAGSQLLLAGVGGQNTQGGDGVGALLMVGRERNGGGGGNGTLNVSNGGSVVISDNGLVSSPFTTGLRIGNTNSVGAATVSGPGSSIVVSGGSEASPRVLIGDGGIGQMTISNGASVSVQSPGQRNFIVGNASTGSGTLTVTNGGVINASRFAVADVAGATGVATINSSTITLDGPVFVNGFNGPSVGAGVRVGRGEGANGVLSLQNGATININNSIAGAAVNLGGTGALAAGTGTLNMSGGSSINFTGSATGASLEVGSTTGGTGIMAMTGTSVVNMGATGRALVANAAGSVGSLTVEGGSVINANVIGIGGNSDTLGGGIGSAVVTGVGSKLNASGANGFISVGHGGTGSLTVTNQGLVSATVLAVGRGNGGVGTLTVNNGQLNLTGQQSDGTGARLVVGVLGGTGTATIANSIVDITNPGTGGAAIYLGGTPLNPSGTGTLNVTGSQINVNAAPGLATVNIGQNGTGTATLSSSTLNIGSQISDTAPARNGSLIVAAQPGSVGTLTLSTGSVVNTGYVGIGATQAGQGGTGHLILNNGTINTAKFELGANSVVSGDNGTINATGDVVIGGTIDPGNSPGRININCNIVTLAGSRLILEIARDGEDFAVDHVTIGSESTFDLAKLEIVFTFLGDINPTTYAASGRLDLDNFLESFNPLTGKILGLSSVFGNRTWADVVDAANIRAVSDFYDVTNLRLQGDGSITLNSAPIPEPSTWALMIAGMLFLSMLTRRRQQIHARISTLSRSQ
jgi:autotransporter family porin